MRRPGPRGLLLGCLLQQQRLQSGQLGLHRLQLGGQGGALAGLGASLQCNATHGRLGWQFAAGDGGVLPPRWKHAAAGAGCQLQKIGGKRLRRTSSGAAALGSHMESRSGLSSLQARHNKQRAQGSLVQHRAVEDRLAQHRAGQCALCPPRPAPPLPTLPGSSPQARTSPAAAAAVCVSVGHPSHCRQATPVPPITPVWVDPQDVNVVWITILVLLVLVEPPPQPAAGAAGTHVGRREWPLIAVC